MRIKPYSNTLFQILVDEGFDVNSFDFEPIGQDCGYIFTKSSEHEFSFQFSFKTKGNFEEFKIEYVEFKPGSPEIKWGDNKALTFDEVKDQFRHWLNKEVKRYFDNELIPNYWSLLKENGLTIEDIDFSIDTPFKEEEKEILKVGLNEVKILIQQNFSPTNSQTELVNQKIEYLIKATERGFNKTDWKGIAISTIIAISYDLSLSEDKRQLLYNMFSKIWTFMQSLPPALI